MEGRRVLGVFGFLATSDQAQGKGEKEKAEVRHGNVALCFSLGSR
jgi:hypothetical protein